MSDDLEETKGLVDDIDLETVDMSLDADLASEAMGGERYRIVVAYTRLLASIKANRAVGNTKEAEAGDKQLAAMRMSVALIDRDHPKAKAVMDRMAREEKVLLASRRNDGA